MMSFLKEPLVHFFILGAAIFALYGAFDDSPPPLSDNMLVVTADDARRLASEFEATWRRKPTPEELDYMIGQYVREEVYVREALALGFDQDDSVIRRRLQMKMEFLTESGAQALNPDDATLEAYLAANADRFAVPPLIAFEQLVLAETVADGDIPAIIAALNGGGDPGAVARPSLLPPAFRLSPERVIDGTFGTGFAAALADLPVGDWAGPVETALGRHLVRVTERRDARLPALDEIRDRVEEDWRAEMTADLRDERLQALLSRYEVVLPDAEAVLSQ